MATKQPDFDNRFNRAFGDPVEKIAAKVRDAIPDPVREFIAQSPFLVMATSNAEGWCDASPKGGKPGFVKVLDDTHLLVPDVKGNRLFQSYLNMEQNPHVGLVFFIPGCPDVARVNGKVTILSGEELEHLEVELSVHNPDPDRMELLQGILVEVEEAYAHCPRAINYTRLWDVEQIKRNGATQRLVRPGRRLEPARSGVPDA